MNINILKIIAVLCMVCDHLFKVMSISYNVLHYLNVNFGVPQEISSLFFGILGRVAAPIFLFLISNGYLYTKNIKKYLSRLITFAFISQFPYILAYKVWDSYILIQDINLNIIFTLACGLGAIWLFDRLSKSHFIIGALCVLFSAMLAKFLHMEGSYRYIIYIFIFFIIRNLSNKMKILIWIIILPLSYFDWSFDIIYSFINNKLEIFELESYLINVFAPFLGILLTLLYNGKKQTENKTLKYLWYFFYPIHLFLIGILGIK